MPKARKNRKYVDNEQAANQLAEALTHLPDPWIICRDMRHAWNVLVDFHVTQGKGRNWTELRRILSCGRCETERIEVYHHGRYGLDKVGQHYKYPEHYQIKGVPRGVKPQSIVQEEQFRRAMERIASSAKGA